jgi:hypothetical protein
LQLGCHAIENFAQSLPVTAYETTVGALIDSDLHAQVRNRPGGDEVIDFKTQVQQYLAYEDGRFRIPQRLQRHTESIVFTVFFGLWDLLEYSQLEKEFAVRAVDASLSEMFSQLDILAMHTPTPLKVIVPRMADTTFLPRFHSNKNVTEEHFAEKQVNVVFAHAYWDAVLVQTAAQWTKGEIFAPDVNAMLVDQIMERQMRSDGIADAFGNGRQRPLFQYVNQPCLQTRTDSNKIRLQPAAVEKCSDPAAHLFWSVNVHTNTMFRSNQVVGMTYA